MREQDGVQHFVRDGNGRYSMTEIPDEWIENADYDIWGAHVVPWIERLHREASA